VRYLIVSDIHANREALEAVLESAEGKYDQFVCCGDLVGYGADPHFVLEWSRKTLKIVVRGNHDKACAGLDDLEWFNPSAKASALWTLNNLEPAEREYLASLPQGPTIVDGFSVIHGSPVDEDEYLLGPRDALSVASYLESSLTFFGHTHVQGGFVVHRNGVSQLRPITRDYSDATLELNPDLLYMLNPGSVGQPRDGDPRAAYAVYKPEEKLVEYYRVAYDIAGAQQKIRGAGLPNSLADRLARGT
jgi:predicted phosphodiesterase